MTLAYYNEIDPYAAQWLRNLIAAGHIAPGDVDERSIVDVRPADLRGYTQCHFFAGIGGWSLAARLAGWPDDKPLWTGSCPCQPFSAAGKRKGTADERHLWPEFFRLIDAERPSGVAGEQVASKDGLGWLDGVCADLEGAGYATWAADFCAAGVGAPHIRQRLYWLADADKPGSQGQFVGRDRAAKRAAGPRGVAIRLEHAESDGREQGRPESGQWGPEFRRGSDGKCRRVKPDIEPLAHGISGRVGRLRAYGNAIVPQVAAEILRAYLEGMNP